MILSHVVLDSIPQNSCILCRVFWELYALKILMAAQYKEPWLKGSVALPHGTIGWSAVCDCGIS